MDDLMMMPRRRPPKRATPFRTMLLILIILLVTAAASAGAYAYWKYEIPNSRHVGPDFQGLAKPIFYQGKMFPTGALGEKAALELPFDFVQQTIDPHIRYESSTQSVILTTANKVVRMRSGQLTAMVNDQPQKLDFPVEVKGSIVYVPIAPLEQLYDFRIDEDPDTGAVILHKAGDTLIPATVRSGKPVVLRTGPGIKYPIVADVQPGQNITILGDSAYWYKAQLKNGYEGYLAKDQVILEQAQTIARQQTPEVYVPWHPLGGKIDMTWEQVFSKTPNPDTIGKMDGLNVISPTWFELATDKQGQLYVRNLADLRYAEWAHSQGYQVWALFSNGFLPDQTHEALATYDNRIKWIRQLLIYAKVYGLQGINIDFENVNPEDKDLLTEFVREMVPLMHEQNLVVSIDVTVKGGSVSYSQFFDRAALGQIADYMVLMAYDEHWASDPQAGSVASLPWVESGLEAILHEDHVPADKMILGVPFYTRVWTESTQGGKTKVTSKAYGMKNIQSLLQEKKLKPRLDPASDQDYVSYQENGKTYEIWLEDARSMQARADLVRKYHLAGIASWSRGFDTPDIWTVVKDELTKLP